MGFLQHWYGKASCSFTYLVNKKMSTTVMIDTVECYFKIGQVSPI